MTICKHLSVSTQTAVATASLALQFAPHIEPVTVQLCGLCTALVDRLFYELAILDTVSVTDVLRSETPE